MFKLMRRATLQSLIALTAITACPGGVAQAASYPDRPIHLIVGVAPGGGADLIARLLAEGMSAVLGQAIVVENRPGAGGNIAADHVARSKGDGYTLLVANSSHAINSTLYKHLTFDPIKDFAPISQLTSNFFFLTVLPNSPAHTVAELVKYAKAGSKPLAYASAGIGQGSHLGMAIFLSRAGIDGLHIPYSGTGPESQALLSGQVDMALLTPPGTLPYVQTKKIRVLAVTAPTRVKSLPDVPTIAESGYPGFEVNNWQGLLAPASTPPEILQILQRTAIETLKRPEVINQLQISGTDPAASTSEAFGRFLKSETDKWGDVVKQTGATAS
jgi:tripartite-type tricarboxylate transporter receptor subunit TctC